MSDVLAGVMEKVKAALPDQVGDNSRFDTATVQNLILAADNATRDLCELGYTTTQIDLNDDVISYDIPSHFISISKVEFASDGSDYDWVLKSVSMADMDQSSYSWRLDRGSRPDAYTLLSAPGVQDNGSDSTLSQIVIYPGLKVSGSAKIKLYGISSALTYALDLGLVDVPEDVQIRCHVPYVMSVLLAVASPARAAEYWQKFLQGCEAERARFRSEYKDNQERR